MTPSYTVKDLPADERPRERLLRGGASSLSDAELLAIILRTGLPGEMVTELASSVLSEFGGFWGLAEASIERISTRRGLKGAKVAQLKAAIEIGRRMTHTAPDARAQVTTPEDVDRLVRFEMAGLEQEEMRVILLDIRHTQLSAHAMDGSCQMSAIPHQSRNATTPRYSCASPGRRV